MNGSTTRWMLQMWMGTGRQGREPPDKSPAQGQKKGREVPITRSCPRFRWVPRFPGSHAVLSSMQIFDGERRNLFGLARPHGSYYALKEPFRQRAKGGRAEAEMEEKQPKRPPSLTCLVTLVGFCEVRLPRFPIAPKAHPMRAQATGLGIGHNNRSKGLKARHIPPPGIHRMMPGLQPLNRFNVPFPGAVPQAGMDRTVGAGEGGWRVWLGVHRFAVACVGGR